MLIQSVRAGRQDIAGYCCSVSAQLLKNEAQNYLLICFGLVLGLVCVLPRMVSMWQCSQEHILPIPTTEQHPCVGAKPRARTSGRTRG